MLTSFPGTLLIYGLTALGSSSVVADYYVDNANSTVAYAATGTNWRTFFPGKDLVLVTGPGQNVTVDSTKCYDQNYSLAACAAEDNCQITIPFTGSGITFYVVQAGFQGVVASLKIDGGQSVTATLPPPTAPSFQTFNVSLFNIQSLPSAPHAATINLLNWENKGVSLYFDYARINESRFDLVVPSSLPSTPTPPPGPAATTSSAINSITAQSQSTIASSALSTTSSSAIGSKYTQPATSAASSTASSVHLGPILGGACGGLAVLIAIVTAIVFLRRRAVKSEKSRRPDPFTASPHLVHGQIVSSTTPPTRKRMGLDLLTLNAALPRSPTQSSSELSIVQVPLAAGSIRRDQAAESGFRDSIRDSNPPSAPIYSAPPGYETLEDINTAGVPPPLPH